MRTKILLATLLLAVAVAGTAGAAIRYAKGALVMTWPGPSAETRANVIAAGDPTPTGPDFEFLPVGTPGGFGGLPYAEATDSESNGGGTNTATATARYNGLLDPPGAPAAGALFVDVFAEGNAGGALGNSRDGNGVAAIGDTAVDVAFSVRTVPTGGTTANLEVRGTALLQRTIPGPGWGRLDVIVYPDTVTANLDPTGSGHGAIFVGRLIVDKDGIEKADGGFAPGDFQVQLTTNHARVRAGAAGTGFTKGITCPNSASLVTVLAADNNAQQVPGHTPFMIGILSLLMAGVGFMALRRKSFAA